MRLKNLQPVLLTLLLIGAVSCQKEVDYVDLGGNPGNPDPGGNPSNNSIIGTWKFVKIVGVSKTSIEATFAGDATQNISTMLVDSKEASGTMSFTETTITTSKIKYSASTTTTGVTYVNGSLESEVTMPYDFVTPESSGSSKYRKVTADSIYVESGLINIESQPGSPTVAQPTGAKISWLGDTLVLGIKARQQQTIDAGGTPAKVSIDYDYKSKYIKQ